MAIIMGKILPAGQFFSLPFSEARGQLSATGGPALPGGNNIKSVYAMGGLMAAQFVRTLKRKITKQRRDSYSLPIPVQIAAALGLEAGGIVVMSISPGGVLVSRAKP